MKCVRVIVGLVLIILVGSIQISYAQTKPMEYIIVKGALGDKEHLGIKLISGYTGVSINTIFEFTSWGYKRVGENLELTNNKGKRLVLNVEDTLTYPKIATKMRCEICDEERTPTKEEKIKYKIPIKL